MEEYLIRPIENTDFESILKLLSDGFGGTKTLWKDRMEMWWNGNPYMEKGVSRGEVIENGKKEIVGFHGNVPVRYIQNGKIVLAVAGTSVYIKPEARGKKLGRKLVENFCNQQQFELFLINTPIDITRNILSSFGFFKADFPRDGLKYWYIHDHYRFWTHRFLKIIRNNSLLQRISKGIPEKIISSSIKSVLSPIKLLEVCIKPIINSRMDRIKVNKYSLEICTSPDSSMENVFFDTIDEKTTLYRNCKTLKWLCFSNLVKDRRFLVQCRRTADKKTIGYFVFDLINENNLKFLHLKDQWISEFDEDIIQALLSFSIKFSNEFHITAISLWAMEERSSRILKGHLIIRNKMNYNYYIKTKNSSPIDKNRLFLSMIDPDSGTI